MNEKNKRMYCVNGDYEEFDIPVYLKEYYDSIDIDVLSSDDLSLLTKEQCLDTIAFLVSVDKHLSYTTIHMNGEFFKGIGLFGEIEVAFFGKKYGPTKFAITLDEFKEYDLSNDDIINITKDLVEFFQKSVRYS